MVFLINFLFDCFSSVFSEMLPRKKHPYLMCKSSPLFLFFSVVQLYVCFSDPTHFFASFFNAPLVSSQSGFWHMCLFLKPVRP